MGDDGDDDVMTALKQARERLEGQEAALNSASDNLPPNEPDSFEEKDGEIEEKERDIEKESAFMGGGKIGVRSAARVHDASDGAASSLSPTEVLAEEKKDPESNSSMQEGGGNSGAGDEGDLSITEQPVQGDDVRREGEYFVGHPAPEEASQVISLDEGGESIGGAGDAPSLEGSQTTSPSKKSLRRDPTDPTKYNAVAIKLCYASGIRQWDASCDPFALVTIGSAKTTFDEKVTHCEDTGYHDSLYETAVIENTSEPQWDEACTLMVPSDVVKAEVHILIQDKDMGKGDDLGEARIRLTKFICDDAENPTEAELPLTGPGAGTDDPTIFIKLNFANVEDDGHSYEGSSVSGSLVSEDNPLKNRRELMHPGEWIPEVWEVGRIKKWTGYWTCCGNGKHLSMYCPSLGDRVTFAHKLHEHREYLRLKPIKEAKAKELRNKWLAEKKEMKEMKAKRQAELEQYGGEEPLSELEKKHFFMSKEWKQKHGIWREPVTDKLSEAHGADENDLYEHRMRMVKPSDISMVISAMRKNISSHWMVDQGFEIIKRLLDVRDAQKKCIQFGALPQILGGLKVHQSDYNIQLKGMTALRKYCTYNVTQEKAILNIEVTNMGISRLKLHRDKEEMVMECLEILKFTAQLRKNRLRIFEMGSITHITCAVVGYRSNPQILCCSFFLLETLSTMARGKEEILSRGLVKIALSVMQQYQDNEAVLAAAMGMLLLACEDERGLLQMIQSNGVATTLYAMKHLVHKAELQQRGLEFMKKLASTTKGASILDDIKGSWQWLAQGTESGNALIHMLPGSLQSKGWCMGETNDRDVLHRGILFQDDAKGVRGKAVAMWTSGSLKKYMGLSQKEQTMDINKVEHDFYFKTIRDLGLLPRSNEEREYWFQRIKKFEKHHGINIEELVERNLIRTFGGTLSDETPGFGVGDGDADVQEGEEAEGDEKGSSEKTATKETQEPATGHGAAPPMKYREVKRKAALGTRNRPPPQKVEPPQKIYEKRPVFLEGVVSSGWVSEAVPWERQHNPLYDDDHGTGIREGEVAHQAAHHHMLAKGEVVIKPPNDDDFVDPGAESAEGDEDEDDDDDDDDDDSNDDGSVGSTVSFEADGMYKKGTKAAAVVKHAHRGKVHSGHKLILPKSLASRKPEKRRDVFHAKDRHGDLYIPAPLEESFPEVIGTPFETAKSKTARSQYTLYEDPYRFGKTSEELAAMDAAADLGEDF